MSTKEPSILEAIAALPVEPSRKLDHLPTDKGLPLVGNTFEFINRPHRMVERQKRQLGPVFQNSMFFRRTLSMCEPDAAELILIDKEQNFSSQLGWVRMRFLFDRGILLRDFDSHRIHRRPLQAAFKSAVMRHYAEQLNELIRNEIAQWDQISDFKFQPAIKSLLLENAAAIFLGAELGEESSKLNRAFVDMLDGVLSIVRRRIPGFAYHRSIKGKETISQWLDGQYEHRIHSDKEDFFTSLCKASLDPEHAMSKQEVIEHTLLLLFAAHDTTTSILSNMVSLLCQHEDWQEKMRVELQNHQTSTLAFNDLSEFESVDRVLKESLRLFPPVFTVPRRAINDFEYKGHIIPSNSAIMLQIYSIHHDEKYWDEPFKFDPDRWSPERSEYRRHPYQYVPFGAGAHKCIGFRFAEMQSKIFLFHFLRTYSAKTAADRVAKTKMVPTPLPKDKLPLELKRI